jgi:hypothetical protein
VDAEVQVRLALSAHMGPPLLLTRACFAASWHSTASGAEDITKAKMNGRSEASLRTFRAIALQSRLPNIVQR